MYEQIKERLPKYRENLKRLREEREAKELLKKKVEEDSFWYEISLVEENIVRYVNAIIHGDYSFYPFISLKVGNYLTVLGEIQPTILDRDGNEIESPLWRVYNKLKSMGILVRLAPKINILEYHIEVTIEE